MDNINTRTSKYKKENGEWASIDPLFIVKGMRIKLFEPSELVDEDGELVGEFIAVSDSYTNDNGVIGIQVERLK